MRLFKAIFLCFSLFVSVNAFANLYLNFSMSPAMPFPANVLVGKTAYADVIVKNVEPNGKDFPVAFDPVSTDSHFSNVPDFTPLPGEPVACDQLPNGVLNNGDTCTARVSVTSGTAVSGLPTDPLHTGIYGMCAVFSPQDKYCDHLISPQVNIVPVLPDPVNLSVTPNPINLMPGQTTSVTVTNTGDQVANDVVGTIPVDPSDITSQSNTCLSIAAGGSCTMTFTLSPSAPVIAPGNNATFQGSNTNEATVPVTSAFSKVVVTGIHYTQPGVAGVEVSNQGNVPLSGLSIAALTADVHGVVAGTGATPCTDTLAANTSCDFYYTAASDAYGTSPVSVTYSDSVAGTQTDSSQAITVDPTAIVINPDPTSGAAAPVIGDTNNLAGKFTVKNTGKFALVNTAVTKPDADKWLTLTPDAQLGCTGEVAPGASCTMDYAMTVPFGVSSTITAAGANASAVTDDFISGNFLAMGVEKAPSYQHYQYAAVYVKNLTNVPVTLDTLTADVPAASTLNGKVLNCDQAGANCDPSVVGSDVCKVGDVLAANTGACHIWYKVNTLLPSGSDKVTITVAGKPDGATDKTITHDYQLCFQNSLVVGGGNRVSGFLDIWNGSAWDPIGKGTDLNGSVQSLALYKGDLYVGGSFSQAGSVGDTNLIARWNGQAWLPVAQGLLSNTADMPTVNALYNDTANHLLYVGGYFGSDKAKQTVMSDVGYWDGSVWHAMGDGVHTGYVSAITKFKNQIIVGGNFVYVNKAGADGLASWDPATGAWAAIPFTPAAKQNNYNQIYALAANDSAVYIGGQFTVKVGDNNVMNIMSWDGTNLVPLKGTVTTGSASSPVNALVANGDDIYIGGGGFSIGGQFYQHLTQYAVSTGVFSDVGGSDSPLGNISAITLASDGLYIGQGKSTTPNQSYAMHWDGSNWGSVGSGTSLPGTVNVEMMLPQLVINPLS